ncbi:hypothetical protein B0H19DRAFT_1066918 [Mycena capillaripes]|nr:hypothetical protein B0H19DRAFT_1066918 [Mycena capillaripes]
MRVSSVFAIVASAAVVSAQSIQIIKVGATADAQGGPLVFTPNNINATNGTIVSFQFTGFPGNHSVTQSSLASPCEPLANGFDSGWVSVPQTLTPPPEWNITITNDQAPIWFYCKQLQKAPHCKAGMVGVINLGVKSFETFTSNAAAASDVGQGEGGFVGVGASATGAPFLPSGAGYTNPSATQAPKGAAIANGVSTGVVLLASIFGMALTL